MEIQECKALITGGSKGIGFAIAKVLKDGGAKVAITARDPQLLNASAKQIGVEGIVADVRREQDCSKAVGAALKWLGGLNVLVNNAGIGYKSPLESVEVELFKDVWSTNVLGAMLMSREVSHVFKKQKYGSIINIASTAALRGYENATAYVASKFALRGMTQCWQAELRRFNIRVILINPSEVQTNFGRKQKVTDINPKKLLAEDVAHTVASCLTMHDRGFIPEITLYATNPW